MKIKKLILSGYTRLSLNNIHYIEYTPESKIQLILGTNGSGKSSLMKELTPLPGLPIEFNKDGYKVIEIEHLNHHYLLKNLFSGTGNKFHFLKDGEELNPGHTVTVYKELVKKEFNITPDVHDLMVGITRFHSMSSFERRTWFTKISDADYTFAIKYYNRIKEQLRDIQGAVKLNQSRLVQESGKLLKDEEEALLRLDISKLNELLTELLEKKVPTAFTKFDLDQKLKDYDVELKTLIHSLIRYRSQFQNHERYESVYEIDNDIINHATSIKVYEEAIQSLYQKAETHNNTLEALAKANNESIQSIEQTFVELTENCSQLYRQLRHDIHFDDPRESYNSLLSVYENLLDISFNLEANPDNKLYNKEVYQFEVQQQLSLNQQILALKRDQSECQNRRKELEHFKQHNETQCPKCEYKWYQGYDERTYQQVLIKESEVEKCLITATELLQKTEEKIANIKNYFNYLKVYTNITSNWSSLLPIWSYINNSRLIFNEPSKLKRLIEDLKMDLTIQIKLSEVQKRIKETEELKILIEKNENIDKEKIEQELSSINETLLVTTRSIQAKRSLHQKLLDYRKILVRIEEITTQVERLQDNKEKLYEQYIHILRRDGLNEIIQLVQLDLSKKEQILSRIDIQKAVVNNLELEITKLQEEVEVLKYAVKELSPTEGLIAKGLTGFINQFVYQINSFIRKVWLYDLELVAIEPDEADLDYKFAVKVGGKPGASDIKLTSSGMREIIDLAFKIVSSKYLKLDHGPLFLDEFGATFDPAHRQSAFFVITNLFTSSNFSQIFMISHYENSYGSMRNTDITVLCGNNIQLGKDLVVNQVAIIK